MQQTTEDLYYRAEVNKLPASPDGWSLQTVQSALWTHPSHSTMALVGSGRDISVPCQQLARSEQTSCADSPVIPFPRKLLTTEAALRLDTATTSDYDPHIEQHGGATSSTSLSMMAPLMNSGEVCQPQTTLMVRNIPLLYTQEMLVAEWPNNATYDLVYLPSSCNMHRNMSYCFINFTSEASATDFTNRWHKKRLAYFQSKKPLTISLAEIQGRDLNLWQLRKKWLRRAWIRQNMPLIFEDGVQVPLGTLMDRLVEETDEDIIARDTALRANPHAKQVRPELAELEKPSEKDATTSGSSSQIIRLHL